MKACIVEEILTENGIKYTKREGDEFTKFSIDYEYGELVLTDEIFVKKGIDYDKILYAFLCDLKLLRYDMLNFDEIYVLIKHHKSCFNK